MKKNYYFLFLLTLLYSCASYNPYYKSGTPDPVFLAQDINSPLKFSAFLIGDAGKPSTNQTEPTFKLLKSQLQQIGKNSSVTFLGDNIYQEGLPDSSHLDKRLIAEKYIIEQLKVVQHYEGRIVFLPGNHDWKKGGKDGWKQIQNQERFIEQYHKKGNIFLPDGGCPGPIEIPLTDDIVMLVLDTQWWLHQNDKPGIEQDCDAKTDSDFLALVDDAVKRNLGKKIIVTAHHPLRSNGPHGGHFPLIEHVFPFARKKAYIPLPVLGSMYVGYRKYIGSIQDIPNIRYKQLKNVLFKIFESHPNLIYAAGHDHNLQYHSISNWHHIVSGAGSKESWIAKNKKAEFAYSHKGFARVDFHENGEVWLRFFIPEGDGNEGSVLFRKKTIYKSEYLRNPYKYSICA